MDKGRGKKIRVDKVYIRVDKDIRVNEERYTKVEKVRLEWVRIDKVR